MNKWLAALMSVGILAGCQDNSSLEREVSALRVEVAALRAATEREPQPVAAPAGSDSQAAALRVRLDRVESDLADARRKLAKIEAGPSVTEETPAEDTPAPAADKEAAYKSYLEFEARRRAEQEEERRKREAERNAEWARIATEYGIDFDPGDVQGSIRRIMRNPEQMQKAMQAVRAEADKRRFAGTGLDEHQVERVKKIEADTRAKLAETMREARQNSTPADEVSRQVEQVNKDQENELKSVMTEEQYKKYLENGGPAAGMIPGGLGDLIPGWGGGRNQ